MLRDNLRVSPLQSLVLQQLGFPHEVCYISYSVGKVKNSKGRGGGEGGERRYLKKWSKMQEYLQGAFSRANLTRLLL